MKTLQPLPRPVIPWLFVVALVTTLPHVRYQPIWLFAMTGLLLLWAGWHGWQARPPVPSWLKFLLVISGCASILFQYKTLLGRDSGVAMLVLFMALKLLELKSRRDAFVLIILGYFLLLTHYFYSQSIGTGAWLMTATLILTGSLVHLSGNPETSPQQTLGTAAKLLFQALPFMLLLYLLFPRISAPLWGLPKDAHSGMTGLSDTMHPGSLSNLAQSGEIAFRANFAGPLPPKEKLYWRGPVMETYDGQAWQTRNLPGKTPVSIEALGPGVSYTLTLEPHNQRWLLALDMPTQIPKDEAELDDNGVTLSKTAIQQRFQIILRSAIRYRLNKTESADALSANLQLPRGRNPKTRALAREWLGADPDPTHLIQKALAYFRNEPFSYTLTPPLLGQEAMDEFLFTTRRGFCEHYASAFVFLMRAAGVPARVVAGYQGGEINPIDGFLVVRQSDAHAWAEVWLKDQGWIRVDPTGAISPSRIESGIASALSAGEPLPALIATRTDWLRSLRHQWEAVNNSWNQWVLGYNPVRQKELLTRLGLDNPNWKSMVTMLALGMGLLLLILAAWIFRPRRETDPARAIWQKAVHHLRRRGIQCPDWESPLALAERLQLEAPNLALPVFRLATLITAARYELQKPDLKALRIALRDLH